MPIALGLGWGLPFTRSAAGGAATAVPANTVVPTVSGIATAGQTLTGRHGSYDQPVTGYAYKWQVSTDGSTGWADISGATAATYALQSADATKYVRFGELPSNTIGPATDYAFSDPVGPIAAALTIAGTPATTATVGIAYSFAPTTGGGHTPKTWSIVGKPSWAAFSTATGQLTGTPTGAETDSGIVISVTDADGLTVSLDSFDVVVSAAELATAQLVLNAPAKTGFTYFMRVL